MENAPFPPPPVQIDELANFLQQLDGLLNDIEALENQVSAPRNHPELFGDTTHSTRARFKQESAPRGARHSQVRQNLRPPNWNRTPLPAFEKNLYTEHSSAARRSPADADAYRKANEISVRGRGVPMPLFTTDEVILPEDLTKAIQTLGYGPISSIFAQCWPVALSGRDLFAIVKKEPEGKALGYLLPAIVHIRHQEPLQPCEGPIVLVLADSRQSVQRIQQAVRHLEKYTRLRVVWLSSGASREEQLEQLEKGAEICVATPGRLVSFMEDCKVNLRRCTYLVVDGVDRMMAMGIEKQLRIIADNIRPDRQTLMWNTISSMEIEHCADELLTDYIAVTVGASKALQAQWVQQIAMVCEDNEKENVLIALLQEILCEEGDQVVVYVLMRQTVDSLLLKMKSSNFLALGIHGKKTEEERNWALSAFRFRKVPVLVATGAAAPGMNVVGVRFVVNYDYPRDAEEYAQRVKLAARADGTGKAYTFLAPTDNYHAKELISVFCESNQAIPPELLKVAKRKAAGGRAGAARTIQ